MKYTKQQLQEVNSAMKQMLSENRRYPSQEDAQFVLDWIDALNNIYRGGSSTELRTALDAQLKTVQQFYQKMFNDQSPWTVVRSGNKMKLKWDKDKASKLSI